MQQKHPATRRTLPGGPGSGSADADSRIRVAPTGPVGAPLAPGRPRLPGEGRVVSCYVVAAPADLAGRGGQIVPLALIVSSPQGIIHRSATGDRLGDGSNPASPAHEDALSRQLVGNAETLGAGDRSISLRVHRPGTEQAPRSR